MSGEMYEMIKKEPNKDYQLSFLLEDIVRQIEEKTIDYDQKTILLSEKDDPFHEITLNYLLWRKDKKYDKISVCCNCSFWQDIKIRTDL